MIGKKILFLVCLFKLLCLISFGNEVNNLQDLSSDKKNTAISNEEKFRKNMKMIGQSLLFAGIAQYGANALSHISISILYPTIVGNYLKVDNETWGYLGAIMGTSFIPYAGPVIGFFLYKHLVLNNKLLPTSSEFYTLQDTIRMITWDFMVGELLGTILFIVGVVILQIEKKYVSKLSLNFTPKINKEISTTYEFGITYKL